jgi:hypothetical protein
VIQWTLNGPPPLETAIYLLREGETAGTLLAMLPGKHEPPRILYNWKWQITENLPGEYRIRVVAQTEYYGQIEDVSDGCFAILVALPITPLGRDGRQPLPRMRPVEILCPNGSERYELGEPICITWNCAVANADCGTLMLSTDGGLTYPIVLAEYAEPGMGTNWIWETKQRIGKQLRVALVVTTPNIVYFDASNENFSIAHKRYADGPDGQGLMCAPNPFVSSTTISFTLPVASAVKLRVFDVTGRTVADLLDAEQATGSQVIHWSPVNLPSGLYIARLETPGNTQMLKLLLTK